MRLRAQKEELAKDRWPPRGPQPYSCLRRSSRREGGDERYTQISRHEAMERGDARHLVAWPWKRHGQPGLLVDKVSYSGTGSWAFLGC